MTLENTLQSCSQFSGKENICQLALAVALFWFVLFIKVNVIKIYSTCKGWFYNKT